MDAEIVTVLRGKKRQYWEQLLRASGLEPEEAPQQTVLLWDEGTLAATGSETGTSTVITNENGMLKNGF